MSSGSPPDWYLRAASLLDPEALEASGEAAADRLIDSAVVTGWLGPSALTFLREFLAFGRDHGGASGALEALAVGFRDNLERRAASMLRDPRR